jgi:hypothetical protein
MTQPAAPDRKFESASLASRLFARASALSNRIPVICWPVLATLIVQSHVLGNGFLFDDFVHFYSVSNLPFLEAISVPMGGHLLHSFTTVVWTIKSLFGLNPLVFLLLGLIVHLVSVGLLFGIITQLTSSQNLAAFGATLWGMSPFVGGALGWISVHGQMYATCAVLWVLLDIARCSHSPAVLRKGLLWRHTLLLLVAATSFGAGLTSVVVLPLVVALWNPVPAQRMRLLVVYSAVALAVVTLYVITMLQRGDAPDNLPNKAAIILRGLLNLPIISAAFAKLLAIGSSGLIWGPLMIGKIALVPRGSLPFVAAMAALLISMPLLIWGCIVSSSAERRRIFALLVIPCAAYGMIAVARSAGYLAFVVDTPRYHYLSPAVMVVVLCLVLFKLIGRLPTGVQAYGRISYLVWLALVLVPFLLSPTRVTWQVDIDKQDRQYEQSMKVLENALQQQVGNKAIYIDNKPFSVFGWGYTPRDFPGLAALFVVSYPSNTIDGKPVYFLEDSDEIVQMAQAQKGTRIAELIIHKSQVKQP